MNRIPLLLELRSEVILPATSATIGAPETRTVLPGSQLRGAAARLYGALSPDEAWTVFHSGAVRFCDGVPISDTGAPTIPMPLSLHHPKGAAALEESRLSKHVFNVASEGFPEGEQIQQVRDGYLSTRGEQVRPARHGSLRTAIHPDTRTARDGFLFAVDSLARGQRFLACLEADEDVDPGLVERVLGALDGELRLGRSRSAEFGWVACTREGAESLWSQLQSALTPDGPEHQVLLLSDLALRDPLTGAPTLRPTAAALGLPGSARVRLDRSFIRTRRYSPFHGMWRRPQTERQVLRAGSVLYIDQIDGETLVETLSRGVGSYREEGLGRLAVAPRLLDLRFEETAQAPSRSVYLDDPLVRWLQAQQQAAQARDTVYAWVERTSVDLSSYGSLPPSQWGALRQAAAASRSRDDLRNRVEDITRDAGASGNRAGWGRKIGGKTRGQCLQEALEGLQDHEQAALAIRLLARKQTTARQREDGTSRTEGSQPREER